jgi:hypothetical protein
LTVVVRPARPGVLSATATAVATASA